MYLTVSMRLTILAVNSIGSTKLNALPTDSCRISCLRLTMCCCPTREALILGGGFRTFAGPPTVSNGRTTVSKTVALCTTISFILKSIILDRVVCKYLTLQVLKIWRRGRDSNPREGVYSLKRFSKPGNAERGQLLGISTATSFE